MYLYTLKYSISGQFVITFPRYDIVSIESDKVRFKRLQKVRCGWVEGMETVSLSTYGKQNKQIYTRRHMQTHKYANSCIDARVRACMDARVQTQRKQDT